MNKKIMRIMAEILWDLVLDSGLSKTRKEIYCHKLDKIFDLLEVQE